MSIKIVNMAKKWFQVNNSISFILILLELCYSNAAKLKIHEKNPSIYILWNAQFIAIAKVFEPAILDYKYYG